ncbi:MAG TPA: PQQ-binding-like beta-propeller repeat protein [Acidimicrobiales bacterium]|jgi:outer membrane protein assembly factor BamB|nr:PQQ-binding-like beta-propeller repeat protein [Acidimicrobiales bacterium]
MKRRNAQRVAVVALTVTMIASAMVVSLPLGFEGFASASSASSWTVYHGDVEGTGVSTSLKSVDTSKRAWTSPTLNGQIFGEPLVYAGRVYVATENDMVYALSATNGRVVWSRHVGSAVPSSTLPCGNISPSVGITGTPVIDPSRNEIFLVADEVMNGGPVHELVGLSTTSGALELHQRVDPRGADPAALLQRTGLSLDAGRVVFGLGGNYGDCGSYRGRVVSVKETGSTASYFTVDANNGDSQGAVWMGGAAPIVDAKGNIWVSVGNGSVNSSGQAFDDSDSVLELSATLRLKQYFAPSTWAQDNASDRDMSTSPALLADGQVVAAGKSPTVYLLNESHLGGIGKEEASVSSVCGNDIDGGSAVVGMTVYLPCLNGPVAIRVTSSPPALTVLWQSSVGGGPVIVAAGLVWTIGQDGELYGLDAGTGHVRQQALLGAPVNHFPTPSVGDGLLVAASASRVVAFHAAAS